VLVADPFISSEAKKGHQAAFIIPIIPDFLSIAPAFLV
jgi:hypothetical protein